MATYACSDLHGRKDLYLKIKEFLTPDDIVYFLGDAGDRGPDGWELITLIYNDPQFIYLKGNHEDMLVKAMMDFKRFWENDDEPLDPLNYELLLQNGGYKTFGDWARSGDDRMVWISRLDALPVRAKYRNADGITSWLTHAGFAPSVKNREIVLPSDEELLWNRTHFQKTWPRGLENHVIVHGHTSISNLLQRLWKPPKFDHKTACYWYQPKKKVCIDNAVFRTGAICLLNLDTFEPVVFSVDEDPSEQWKITTHI